MAIRTFINNPPAPQANGTVQISVTFIDDVLGRKQARDDIFVPASFTVVQADARLRAERASFSIIDTLVKAIPPGERDIDASIPVPPTPTPEEQARIDYFNALNKVQNAKLHVDLKIIDETQTDYAKLVTEAQALFKPEYLL